MTDLVLKIKNLTKTCASSRERRIGKEGYMLIVLFALSFFLIALGIFLALYKTYEMTTVYVQGCGWTLASNMVQQYTGVGVVSITLGTVLALLDASQADERTLFIKLIKRLHIYHSSGSEYVKKAIALISVVLLSSAILMVSTQLSVALSVGNVIINADGSVTGTNSIQRIGNTYTFTGNISGTVQVQKGNIVIDGAGYSLDEGGIDLTNGIGQNPTRPTISNVTIENLRIVNGGIGTNGGGNHTFCNDYISNSVGAGIMLIGSDYNNITYCTISGSNVSEGAIGMVLGANYNTITENNLTGGVEIWLSTNETVDRNYWSDYLTKYPNATEVDSSGVGDTPYVFYTDQNVYQDNHPLMNPVSNTVSEFPSWTVLPLLIMIVIGVGLLVYFKKRKQ
jgi:hypothetical protein